MARDRRDGRWLAPRRGAPQFRGRAAKRRQAPRKRGSPSRWPFAGPYRPRAGCASRRTRLSLHPLHMLRSAVDRSRNFTTQGSQFKATWDSSQLERIPGPGVLVETGTAVCRPRRDLSPSNSRPMTVPSRDHAHSSELVLVTGATGYIGGRLVARLVEAGYRVRCLVRDTSRIEGRPWAPQVEVVRGDVLDPSTLADAMREVTSAYYLVHSLAGGADFHARDLAAARNFAAALAAAGGRRIVYLGGLGEADEDLSAHLRSRQETGDALREAGVPVTEFRAAVIVGVGQPVLRDGALPHRARAGHDLPAVGLHAHPADRGPQRARLSRRGPGDAGERRADHRDRRRRRRHLRRDDDDVRSRSRVTPPDGAGAGAHASPVLVLGAPGDPGAEGHRAAADRGAAQRSGRAGRQRAAHVPGHRADGLRGRRAAGAAQPRVGPCRDLVGRRAVDEPGRCRRQSC